MARAKILTQQTWEEGYSAAVAYFFSHGDLDVPQGYVTNESFPLGEWIEYERFRHRYGRISPQQTQRLNDIGMLWTKFDVRWKRSFQAVCDYRQTHGDIHIPRNFRSKEGVDLYAWLSAQRQNYKAGKLSAERIRQLNEIGMWWEPEVDRWEMMFEEANAYYTVHGHLRIPFAYRTERGDCLGMWLNYQRLLYANGNYDSQKADRLNSIGMEWREDPWEKRFRLAKDYYEQHGDLNISQNYVTEDGIWLGKWLYLQRKQRDMLTAEQVARLDEIGLQWNSRRLLCASGR